MILYFWFDFIPVVLLLKLFGLHIYSRVHSSMLIIFSIWYQRLSYYMNEMQTDVICIYFSV